MTKPMYCPMSFNNVNHTMAGDIGLRVCTPDCAWAVKDCGNYGCAITYLAAAHCAEAIKYGFIMNARPLKEDTE